MPVFPLIFLMVALDGGMRALDIEIRRKIYDLIVTLPGIHFRELQRRSGASSGVLDYHLHYMESRGLIKSDQGDRHTRYYISGTTTEGDRKAMAALRIGGQRKILIYLLERGGSLLSDVSSGVGLSKSTVSFHTKRLLADGLLIRRGALFYINDPEKTADLIIKYKSTFFDSTVDRFAESWLDLK